MVRFHPIYLSDKFKNLSTRRSGKVVLTDADLRYTIHAAYMDGGLKLGKIYKLSLIVQIENMNTIEAGYCLTPSLKSRIFQLIEQWYPTYM